MMEAADAREADADASEANAPTPASDDDAYKAAEDHFAQLGAGAMVDVPNGGDLDGALAAMLDSVTRVEDLAQLHDEEGEGADEEAERLPNARDGAEYVCLEDAALVDAHTLLRGERRGQPYLLLDEAAAQQRTELARAEARLTKEVDDVEHAVKALSSVMGAWAKWHVGAQAAADAGFAHLEQALALQRAATGARLAHARSDAESSALRELGRLKLHLRAIERQRAAVRRFDARVSHGVEEWEGRQCAAWPALREALARHAQLCRSDDKAAGEEEEEVADGDEEPEPEEAAVEVTPFALPVVKTSMGRGRAPQLPPAGEPSFRIQTEAALLLACTAPRGEAVVDVDEGEDAEADANADADEKDAAAALATTEEGGVGGASHVAPAESTNALLAEQHARIGALQHELAEQAAMLVAAQAQIEALRAQHPSPSAPPPAPVPAPAPTPATTTAGGAASGAEMEEVVQPIFHKEGVRIDLRLRHGGRPGALAVQACLTNGAEPALDDVQMQVAAARYTALELVALPPSRLAAGGMLVQPMVLVHDDPGVAALGKPFKLKIKLEYNHPTAGAVCEQVVVAALELPPGLASSSPPPPSSPSPPVAPTVTGASGAPPPITPPPSTPDGTSSGAEPPPMTATPSNEAADAGSTPAWANFDAGFDATFDPFPAPAPAPAPSPPPQANVAALQPSAPQPTSPQPTAPPPVPTPSAPPSAPPAAVDTLPPAAVAPPAAREGLPTPEWLPKPADQIVAELGIQLGKLGRQVVRVSMADDLPGVVRRWCGERQLSDAARQKIEQNLQTRLDEALAQAFSALADAEPPGMC